MQNKVIDLNQIEGNNFYLFLLLSVTIIRSGIQDISHRLLAEHDVLGLALDVLEDLPDGLDPGEALLHRPRGHEPDQGTL